MKSSKKSANFLICLLGALAAIPATLAQFPSGPTGTYSVRESWTVTVTGPYAPGVITRSGVETGTIQAVNGAYNLINKTGAKLGSFGGQINFDGSQYTVSSDPVVYGFVPVGRDFDAIVVLDYFVVLVPLESTFGFAGFYRDDTFTATGSDLSHLHGSGTAIDSSNEKYVVKSSSTLANGPSSVTNPNAGDYTILLRSTDTTGMAPQGTGYARLTVSRKGGAIISGKLADGKSFSSSGILVGGTSVNQLIINKTLRYPFAEPRRAKGSLEGTLTFAAETGTSAAVTGTSDFNGTLEWTKPQQTKGDFQAPVDTTLNVIGSLHASSTGGSNPLPGFSAGTLTLSDTTGTILSGSAQLTSANKLVISNPPDGLKITLTHPGIFKGSFIYPGQTKRTDFAGALFQDQIIGEGFFLGPNGSGIVTLQP